MIVVFDSGVWISGFEFGGTPLAAVRLAYKEHQIALCDGILDEIYAALVRKFRWSEDRLKDSLSDYLDNVSQAEVRGELHGVCRDPNDDMVIECAINAGADVIVTGDKDLLAVRSYEGIRIITPREFLSEFAPRPEA